MIFNVTSNFQPFTFDELAKPMLMYKQAYDEMEKNLATLTDQTEMWQNIAEQDKSPIAYNLYKTYSDKLNSVVEDFSKGLNAANRGELLKLRRGYASNIVPIANAYNRRQKLQDEVAKAKLQNPYYEFQFDPNRMSLDTLIENPSQTWGKVINGALVNSQVATAAQALAKGIASGDQASLEKLKKLALPYQWEYLKRTGFNYSDVLKVMQEKPEANPILKGLVDNAINDTGIYGWENIRNKDGSFTQEGKDILNRLKSQAYMGLYQAIGQEQAQILTDDYSKQAALQQLASQLTNQTNSTDIPAGTKIDTDDLYFGGTSLEQQAVQDAKILGFNNDGKKYGHHVNIKIKDFDNSEAGYKIAGPEGRKMSLGDEVLPSKSYIKRFRLWGETGKYGTTGKLLTRGQFVAQGTTPEQKKALNDYYNQVEAAKERWISGGNVINEASSIGKNLQGKHGNFKVKGIRYKGQDNVEMISPFINEHKLVQIQKVDNHGNIITINPKTKNEVGMDAEDIQDFNDRAHPAKGTPTLSKDQVQFHILTGDTNKPNNAGIIVSIPSADGKKIKRYLLPVHNMTGNMKQAYQTYIDYIQKAKKEAKQKGYNKEQTNQYVAAVKEQQLSMLINEINYSLQSSFDNPNVSTYKDPNSK